MRKCVSRRPGSSVPLSPMLAGLEGGILAKRIVAVNATILFRRRIRNFWQRLANGNRIGIAEKHCGNR